MDEEELDLMREIIKELKKELKARPMAKKPVDEESNLKTKIKNVQEEVAQIRKGNKKLEMSEKLASVTNEAADVAPEVGGPSFRPSDDTKKTYEGGSSKIKNVQEEEDQENKMSELTFQVVNGERRIADLSQTELFDLIPYIEEKLALLGWVV